MKIHFSGCVCHAGDRCCMLWLRSTRVLLILSSLFAREIHVSGRRDNYNSSGLRTKIRCGQEIWIVVFFLIIFSASTLIYLEGINFGIPCPWQQEVRAQPHDPGSGMMQRWGTIWGHPRQQREVVVVVVMITAPSGRAVVLPQGPSVASCVPPCPLVLSLILFILWATWNPSSDFPFLLNSARIDFCCLKPRTPKENG